MAMTSKVEPKSSHLSDSLLQSFLQQEFDPAAYLNTTLPSLSTPSTARSTHNNSAVPLSDLSTQTQTLLSQLNAQTARLSTTLTQLTDDIIRSGSRLAYEVDLLKGEASGLTDALNDGLRQDIELLASNPKSHVDSATIPSAIEEANGKPTNDDPPTTDPAQAELTQLDRLRTLTEARERLDSVIQLFGRAMAWPLSPSEQASLGSSFISVSAPTGESEAELRTRETKAKEFTEKERGEINELIGNGSDAKGLQEAAERVEELRSLLAVWEGTAEEKARRGFVEGLARMVEEKERAVAEKGIAGRGQRAVGERVPGMRYGTQDAGVGQSGYGFMRGLRKLGDGVYLD
ncbi:hypothetical protein MBLNU230_g3936t1 [Neophaeotheca triangularis]